MALKCYTYILYIIYIANITKNPVTKSQKPSNPQVFEKKFRFLPTLLAAHMIFTPVYDEM